MEVMPLIVPAPGPAPPFFGLGFDFSALTRRAVRLTLWRMVPADDRVRLAAVPERPPMATRLTAAPKVARGP